MEVFHNLDQVRFKGVVLTIGNFDGVHLGHQSIMKAGRRRAEANDTQLVAMTFHPHPATILSPGRVPAALTPIEEKLRLLEECGVGTTIVVPSRPDLFSMPAETFIQEVILDCFDPVAMVEGASFRFGYQRQGDTRMLEAAGRDCDFEVEVVEPIRVGLGGQRDTVISSSLVRQLLESGTVDQAAACLGRPYCLVGKVIRGLGRGRELGYPTANLAVEEQLIPPEGVYAGRVELDGRPVAAAISIGHTPTFEERELVIEAFLLDYEGDLYDRQLRLDFLQWLRPQEKFASVEALCRQMDKDVEQTRLAFRNSLAVG